MEGRGRSRVFISYSRSDLAFANELAAALESSADFEILIDRVGIGHGEAWRERLGRLIVECDTLVFVLSPDSVASEVCGWEVGEARRLSKRIIPVLWRAVDFSRLPDDLGAINAVPFDGERAVSGASKLVVALNSDLDWLREHTRLGERAMEWEQSDRAPAYLLRGPALGSARDWLAAKPANAPPATALQREFIEASEEEQSRLLSDERRRLQELEKAKAIAEAERDAAQQARASEARSARRVVRATSTGLIVAVVLLFAAMGAGWLAYQKAQDEREAAERAASASELANKERDEARLIQSRFLARAARTQLARGDAANAIALARAALPGDLANPDRPFAIEAAQLLFDAYGKLREQATLRGHSGELKGVLALPRGRILTWGRDGTIRWWREDGSLLRTLVAHTHPEAPGSSQDSGVHGVIRLDDGRLLSWGVDKRAKLWSDDGSPISGFLDEESWIRLERLRDGRIGALIGNEYRVWSATLEPLLVLKGAGPGLRGATLLSDGRFLTWQERTAMLWQADGTPGARLEGHKRNLRGALELVDGHIVSFENGPDLRIWSAKGQLEKVIEKAHRHVPLQDPFVFALRDGRFFSWGQEAYHNKVWWARLWTVGGESTPLVEASDSPLQGFELDDGRLLLGIDSPTPAIWHTDGKRGPALRGHERAAYGAVQWPDGRIATYAGDRTARIWSREGAPLLTLRGHEAGVSGIQALAGERYLTWSRRDRTARIWSAQPQPRSVLHFAGGAAKDVQQLSSGSIAVLSNTGSIALFAADLAPGAVLRNGARAVAGLVELADGQLITRGENYANREPGPALRLWNPDGEAVADLAGPGAEFVHLAQSPGGRIIAFERSGQVWTWRADGEAQGRRDAAEGEQLYSVMRLPDGRFLSLSHVGEFRLRLWSPEGEPDRSIRLDNAASMPKRILPHDDGRITVIHHDGSIRIWDSDDQQWSVPDLGEGAHADTAFVLRGGRVLLSQFDGELVLVNADDSVRRPPHPAESGGRHQRRKVIPLGDGRLLVSTSGQGTRLWSADGEPGRQILDTEVAGASLLADGAFVVWPAGDDKTLRIVGPGGEPGPLLRGHEAEIRQVNQLADGRILSRAEDASVRVWPGSVDQALAWADEVVVRLKPLILAERCEYYLERQDACAGAADR